MLDEVEAVLRSQLFWEVYMKIVNTLGRVAVGSAFMMFGYEAIKEPGGRVQAVEALGVPQPELAVRVNGAAMIAGGAALVIGISSRTVPAGLALSLVPTLIAGQSYWKGSRDRTRYSEIIH